jgi:membrane-associated phospholipid phosphatase/Tfp pilus assembly protein PilF
LRREAGDYPAAAASLALALALCEGAGDPPGQGYVLTQLGSVHVLTGDYPAAAASLHRALALARSAGDSFVEGEALYNLGTLQQLTGDYPAAAASHQQALALFGDRSDLLGQAWNLNGLGVVQQETGEYPAAAASQQRALALFCDLGDLYGQAYALNDLGVVQQETGDYPAAAASHQQALALFRDLGSLLGQAEALNRLGELATRTADTPQAREHYTQALAIARALGSAPEEARALEGLGHSHLQDEHLGQAATHLRQALTIYQRIGAPAARRVQETLQNRRLTSTTPEPQPAASSSQDRRPRTPQHSSKPLDRRWSRDTPPARCAAESPDLRGHRPTAVLLAGLGAALFGVPALLLKTGAAGWDVSLFRILNQVPAAAASVLTPLSHLFLPAGILAVFVLTAVYVVARNRSVLPVAAGAVAAGLAWALAHVAKAVADRPRADEVITGAVLRQQPAHGTSFPSSHTAVTLAVAIALVPFLARPLAAAGIAYAVLVGWSRVYLGVHYPLDVLAGAGIGLAAGV